MPERDSPLVASEVKSLASQTAKATEEIRTQIGEIQSATGQTVEAIHSIGSTIRQMSEIATTIASAVEEQGAATREIATNVHQAAQGTSAIASNIEGVSRAASETGAAASQVLGSAGELSRQSDTLRSDVETFLATVRAAWRRGRWRGLCPHRPPHEQPLERWGPMHRSDAHIARQPHQRIVAAEQAIERVRCGQHQEIVRPAALLVTA